MTEGQQPPLYLSLSSSHLLPFLPSSLSRNSLSFFALPLRSFCHPSFCCLLTTCSLFSLIPLVFVLQPLHQTARRSHSVAFHLRRLLTCSLLLCQHERIKKKLNKKPLLLVSFLLTKTPLSSSPPLLTSPSNSDSATATLARPPAFTDSERRN